MTPSIRELIVPTPGGEEAVLATKGLRKRFGSVVALADLSLEVPKGTVYVLVGPNGAGKTTFMRVVMGLLKYDEGSVDVMGIDPNENGGTLRGRIGYVPEGHRLGYPWMNVGRFLKHLRPFYRGWDLAYEHHLVGTYGVKLNRECGALSKGESRRVQMIQALAYRPELLMLDEPTDGLDHLTRDLTLKILSEHLADTPTTVLISTHRIYEVERLIDQVGLLRAGKLIVQLPRADLRQKLMRYRARVPDGWEPSPWLRKGWICGALDSSEIDWTLWGEPEQVRDEFSKTGATVNQVAPLSLDEIASTLLASEEVS